MKITSIRVSAVNIPTIKSYHVAVLGAINSTASVIIVIHTDQEFVGIGETDPALMFTGESQQTVLTVLKHHLGPGVIGLDPTDIDGIHDRMESICYGNPFAKAAIDIACHDLKGKSLGAPVYELLGGLKRERIPVMWSLGSEPAETNAREAAGKVDEGYQTIGLKLGVYDPRTDIERVRQVRRAVGDKINIRCDANQSWTLDTAVDTIQRLQDYRVAMVEQPLPKWDLEGMARVVRAVEIPVGADESLSSPQDAREIINCEAADFFSIKTTKHGGLLNSKKIAELAHSAGKRLFINSMIEMGVSVLSGLHFGASSEDLFEIGHALNSVRRLKDDILREPLPYDRGEIEVPQGQPGLGCELDKAKMEKYCSETFWIENSM